METSLHRELKDRYAHTDAETEVKLGKFRIDVVRDDELIEIQHGSLAAIRGKVSTLLKKHRVRVVKPIVSRKRLLKRAAAGKRIVDRRMSPKKGTLLDVFHEMVYFCRVFPHDNLIVEVPLVTIEEYRFPGHGRRRRHRQRDHQVEDQKLTGIESTHEFRTAKDFADLLPKKLPSQFDTQQIALGLEIDRWFAQRIAYSLRQIGGITLAGKRGNAFLYERVA